MTKIVLISIVAFARAAFAQSTMPPPKATAPVAPIAFNQGGLPQAPPPPSPEGLLVVGQLAAGGAAVGLMTAAAFKIFDGDNDDDVQTLLYLAPAASGLAVCAVGHFSAYESSCLWSTLGAYLGGLAGGALGYELAPKAEHGPGDIVGYMAVGAVLGTMVGGTTAWHLGKHPRARPPEPAAAPPPLPAADAWPELRRRPALGTTEPGARRIMFPLLALSF